MKKLRILLFLTLILFSFLISGCEDKPAVSDLPKTQESQITEQDYKAADEIARGFINTFYTIDTKDIEFYKKVFHPIDFNPVEMEKATFDNVSKFKPFLLEGTIDSFIRTISPFDRIGYAYENKLFMEVKNVEWQRSLTSEFHKRLTYKCKIEIIQKPFDGKPVKTVTIERDIQVYKEKEGWRVLPDYNLIIR